MSSGIPTPKISQSALYEQLKSVARGIQKWSYPTDGIYLAIARMKWASEEIKRLEAELQRTRAAWVAGDDPDCSETCLEQCQLPEVCS